MITASDPPAPVPSDSTPLPPKSSSSSLTGLETKTVPSVSKGVAALLLLCAALLAAGASWPFVDRFADAFPNPGLDEDMTNRIRADRNDAIAWAKDRELRLMSLSRNAGLNYGFFGLCLGSCLGLTASCSMAAGVGGALRGAALGALLGAISGVGGGLISGWVALQVDHPGGLDTAVRSVLMHAAGWAPIGLACGAIVALRLGHSRGPLMAGGLLGGAFAAAIYEQSAAIVCQLDRSDVPVPEGAANKLLFLVCTGLSIAGVLAALNSRPGQTLQSAAPSPTNGA
ncbi:MAG: hypothetical protein EXS05_13350 [Planctomycetaceae bacterium]|nr:hypothetical protein [Planctomycetaceae bacterium]